MCPGQFEHISASVMNTRFKRMTQGSRLILGILLISMSRDSLAPAESVSAASLAGGVGTTSHPRNQRAGGGGDHEPGGVRDPLLDRAPVAPQVL
jgi:hypothetical protein